MGSKVRIVMIENFQNNTHFLITKRKKRRRRRWCFLVCKDHQTVCLCWTECIFLVLFSPFLTAISFAIAVLQIAPSQHPNLILDVLKPVKMLCWALLGLAEQRLQSLAALARLSSASVALLSSGAPCKHCWVAPHNHCLAASITHCWAYFGIAYEDRNYVNYMLKALLSSVIKVKLSNAEHYRLVL